MAFWDVCGNVAAVWVRYPRAHGGSELHFTFQLYATGRERGSRWLARLLGSGIARACWVQGLGKSLGSHTPWQNIWQLARRCRRRHAPPKDVRGCGSSQQNASSAEQRTGGIFYEDFDWSTGCNVGRIQRSRDLFYLLSFRSQKAQTLVVLCGDRSDV